MWFLPQSPTVGTSYSPIQRSGKHPISQTCFLLWDSGSYPHSQQGTWVAISLLIKCSSTFLAPGMESPVQHKPSFAARPVHTYLWLECPPVFLHLRDSCSHSRIQPSAPWLSLPSIPLWTKITSQALELPAMTVKYTLCPAVHMPWDHPSWATLEYDGKSVCLSPHNKRPHMSMPPLVIQPAGVQMTGGTGQCRVDTGKTRLTVARLVHGWGGDMESWVQGISWWITQLMSLRGSGHYEAVNFGLTSYTTEKIYIFLMNPSSATKYTCTGLEDRRLCM